MIQLEFNGILIEKIKRRVEEDDDNTTPGSKDSYFDNESNLIDTKEEHLSVIPSKSELNDGEAQRLKKKIKRMKTKK